MNFFTKNESNSNKSINNKLLNNTESHNEEQVIEEKIINNTSIVPRNYPEIKDKYHFFIGNLQKIAIFINLKT